MFIRHCGAQASLLRGLEDDKWRDWAAKGAETMVIVAGLKNKSWAVVEQLRIVE